MPSADLIAGHALRRPPPLPWPLYHPYLRVQRPEFGHLISAPHCSATPGGDAPVPISPRQDLYARGTGSHFRRSAGAQFISDRAALQRTPIEAVVRRWLHNARLQVKQFQYLVKPRAWSRSYKTAVRVGRLHRFGVWSTKFFGLDDKLDRRSLWVLRCALAGVREFFAEDLPHLLGRYRFFCGTDALRKRLVDERLIPNPVLRGLSLERSEDLIVDINRDPGLALRWNSLPAPALREVVFSLHILYAPLRWLFEQRLAARRDREAFLDRAVACRCM
jgi:hypothetical protein